MKLAKDLKYFRANNDKMEKLKHFKENLYAIGAIFL
jgi:hypothetical protein